MLIPMNTPIFFVASWPGSAPASSSASQVHSSVSLCCGSMREASLGEMPKNSASN